MWIWILAEFALVFLYAQNDAFVEQAKRQEARRQRERQAEDLEEGLEGLDIEARVRIRRICQIERDIAEEIAALEGQASGYASIGQFQRELEAATDRALRLAIRKRSLHRYLDSTDEAALTRHASEIRARLETADDDMLRRQLKDALAARTQEIEDYAAISRTDVRIDGQLENVECVYSGLKARIVRMKAAESTDWEAALPELENEVRQLNVGFDALDQFLGAIFSPAARGNIQAPEQAGDSAHASDDSPLQARDEQ